MLRDWERRGSPISKHDIIVIGGSAGAIAPLSSIIGGLPQNFGASVFVVLHISAARESWLPNILSRAGRLPALHASDQQVIQPGRIYVAPPDHHLILENRHMNVVHGPKENRARPAIDPLFRSAAINYGSRVIGVLLSGALDDGTAGLRAIKQNRGLTVVQDPADASYPGMPESAIYNNPIDHIVPAGEIAPLLRRLIEKEINAFGQQELLKFERRAEEANEHVDSVRKMLLANPEKAISSPP